ncbi:hypothetical protein CPZ25_016985 [Eubacterium maltosivorans]|uniref:Uncharacterized protein n=1 Tax=Eubacterium maltosivorans TaxID=2041044 RepID=A0A4P9CBD2_EUBML|nr:hypothetical protein CPZ25_016985 [Eubacterium maltosivorans]
MRKRSFQAALWAALRLSAKEIMNRQSLKEKPVQLKVDSGKWKVQVQIRHANLIGCGLGRILMA